MNSFFRWDQRIKNNQPTHHIKGHLEEINSIDFNPYNEYMFLTGSADKTIALWDLRAMTKKLHTFEGHTDSVKKLISKKKISYLFLSDINKSIHKFCFSN